MRTALGPFGAVAVDSLLSPMSGAIIHDPEDAASGLVRLLAHYFTDEALNRGHPVFDFAAAEDLGAMNVPGRQIGPGAFAKVLMLDLRGAVRRGRQRRLFSASSLNTRLLVRRDHEVISTQWSALPNALVEVEDGPALAAKLGSRGKIQLRCCQGRRASVLSQRHNVAPLISATRP
jgi:hypothetical protein